MIRAAAQAARGKGAPPEELEWAWQTRRFGLPFGGGWLDQPAGLLERMEQAARAYDTLREYLAVKAIDLGRWIRDHPRQWQYIQWLEQLERELGDG